MGQITGAVSTTAKSCVTLDKNGAMVSAPVIEPQTDILRNYLMERRRALLTELRSIDRVLGLDTIPAKVTR